MDCSLPGSSVHGILQAIILEPVAIPFSRGSPRPRGSNPGLLHCRQILYRLKYQGSILSGSMVKNHLPVQEMQETQVQSHGGRSFEGGHGNPLQCSHLENPMDRGSWQVPVHGVAKISACMHQGPYFQHSFITVDSELDHLAEAAFARSLCRKGTLSSFSSCTLRKEITM